MTSVSVDFIFMDNKKNLNLTSGHFFLVFSVSVFLIGISLLKNPDVFNSRVDLANSQSQISALQIQNLDLNSGSESAKLNLDINKVLGDSSQKENLNYYAFCKQFFSNALKSSYENILAKFKDPSLAAQAHTTLPIIAGATTNKVFSPINLRGPLPDSLQ